MGAVEQKKPTKQQILKGNKKKNLVASNLGKSCHLRVFRCCAFGRAAGPVPGVTVGVAAVTGWAAAAQPQ